MCRKRRALFPLELPAAVALHSALWIVIASLIGTGSCRGVSGGFSQRAIIVRIGFFFFGCYA